MSQLVNNIESSFLLFEKHNKLIKIKNKLVLPCTISPLNLDGLRNYIQDKKNSRLFVGSKDNQKVEVISLGLFLDVIPSAKELYYAMKAISVTLCPSSSSVILDQVFVPCELDNTVKQFDGLILEDIRNFKNIQNHWLPAIAFNDKGNEVPVWVKVNERDIKMIYLSKELINIGELEVKIKYHSSNSFKCAFSM